MPWQVKLNEQHPILEQVFEGDIDDDGLQMCLNEAVRLAMVSKSCLFLVDGTRYLWPGFDPQKTIILAHQDALGISELTYFDMSSCKVAYVTQPENVQHKYLEVWTYLIANRGVKTKIFTDRDQAIGWLLEQD